MCLWHAHILSRMQNLSWSLFVFFPAIWSLVLIGSSSECGFQAAQLDDVFVKAHNWTLHNTLTISDGNANKKKKCCSFKSEQFANKQQAQMHLGYRRRHCCRCCRQLSLCVCLCVIGSLPLLSRMKMRCLLLHHHMFHITTFIPGLSVCLSLYCQVVQRPFGRTI